MRHLRSGGIGRGMLLAALAGTALAGCGARPSRAPPSTPEPSPRKAPVPPAGALPDLALPERDGAGGFKTMNRGIAPVEAIWHVRAALNVAALVCNDRDVVSHYNALLKHRKEVLADAYRSESRRFGSAAAMDAHMTKLYNFFAQPPAQRAFCAAANDVAIEARSVPAQRFDRFATDAIERMDRPFQDFYHAYEIYRRALAAWRADGGRAEQVAAARPVSVGKQALGIAAPWRVQLGAFSGSAAARAAWIEMRRRAPGLASFQPHYEDALVRGVVRLQIGPASDRREALWLCAAAAVVALDCLPVAPR